MKTLLFILSTLLFCIHSHAQRFDTLSLSSSETNFELLESKIETHQSLIYDLQKINSSYLINGFNSNDFKNPDNWLSIKDSVKAVRVDIVFSKYPLRNGVYQEIYPLLIRRIKSTIDLDPDLNSDQIIWRKVWQTDCATSTEAKKLFHGVVIHYEPKEKVINQAKPSDLSKQDIIREEQRQIAQEEQTYRELHSTVNYILESPFLPDSIKTEVHKLPIERQISTLKDYFTQVNAGKKPASLGKADELQVLQYMNEINEFLQNFPEVEPVVHKVFDRHPEWNNAIVINDWTGSMYSYGAQVLAWHLMNLDNSGITTITLFNDGDRRSNRNKPIGRTGGIYTEQADNVHQLIELFNVVMSRGTGGDGPENSIEAILSAIDNQPDFSEIILIADNTACIRDISLADRIKHPVRVILCGYNKRKGVNPHYVYLAQVTGGGIYTIEEDIEQISAELGDVGEVKGSDERLKITSSRCEDPAMYRKDYQLLTLRKAKLKKKKVRRLNASAESLTEIPSFVYKMEALRELYLQQNSLTLIDEAFENLVELRHLDISENNSPPYRIP